MNCPVCKSANEQGFWIDVREVDVLAQGSKHPVAFVLCRDDNCATVVGVLPATPEMATKEKRLSRG